MTDAEYMALPAKWVYDNRQNGMVEVPDEPEGYDDRDGSWGYRRLFMWCWRRLVDASPSKMKPPKVNIDELMARVVSDMFREAKA